MAKPIERKAGPASPIDYPSVPKKGYFTEAFKKGAAEREILRELKEQWKILIDAEYGHILPKRLLKKVANPTNYRLTS